MFPPAIQNLVALLSKLPGLGPRSAARLALWLINQPQEALDKLAGALINLKKETSICSRCFNLISNGQDFCHICRDHQRDQNTICVVEDSLDILPIERTRCFQGLYHILGGTISPPDNIGPEKLHIKELIERVKKMNSPDREIILALNPTTEGDVTALYLERLLKPLGTKTTRLGRGLSTGSDLEYTDEITLANALMGRK